MYLLGNLGAVSCHVASSNGIPAKTRNAFKTLPDDTNDPGYNKACDCFYWGFKPTITEVLGIRLGSNVSGEWRVCVGDAAKVCATCPPVVKCPACAKCPPAVKCPACATCPAPTACPPGVKCPPQTTCKACPPPSTPQPCPTCVPCTNNATPPTVASPSSSYGPTLGFLLAAGVVGGAGYFAWKKLKKKK